MKNIVPFKTVKCNQAYIKQRSYNRNPMFMKDWKQQTIVKKNGYEQEFLQKMYKCSRGLKILNFSRIHTITF